MKKIVNYAVAAAVVLLMNFSGSAQEKKTIEKIASNTFAVKRAKMIEEDGKLRFQFFIKNKSKQVSPGVEVVVSAYNKSGSLRGRHIWRTSDEMPVDSYFSSTLDVYSGLNGASRYTVEFLAPSQAENFANSDSCTSCTDNAIRACGSGKGKTVNCEVGENGVYSCTYQCKDELHFEIENPPDN
jgi:NRPS condensation-like uncharacterized protein